MYALFENAKNPRQGRAVRPHPAGGMDLHSALTEQPKKPPRPPANPPGEVNFFLTAECKDATGAVNAPTLPHEVFRAEAAVRTLVWNAARH